MDVPLGLRYYDIYKRCSSVLILVVMDVSLGRERKENTTWFNRLNPCCNGCVSRTLHYTIYPLKINEVLILVVMDVSLGLLNL